MARLRARASAGMSLDANTNDTVHLAVDDIDTRERIGSVEVEYLEGNIVITVRRIDEAKFGPVSLVVV